MLLRHLLALIILNVGKGRDIIQASSLINFP